jgi:IS5 family transposase
MDDRGRDHPSCSVVDKDSSVEHDPEMYQTRRGQQSNFWVKAHIVVDANAGRVHSGRASAASVLDVHMLPN